MKEKRYNHLCTEIGHMINQANNRQYGLTTREWEGKRITKTLKRQITSKHKTNLEKKELAPNKIITIHTDNQKFGKFTINDLGKKWNLNNHKANKKSQKELNSRPNNETLNLPRGDSHHKQYSGTSHDPNNGKEKYDTLMGIVTEKKL